MKEPQKLGRAVLSALILLPLLLAAAQIPAGSQLHIRLTSKLSTADAKAGQPVTAVLIAPVLVNNAIVLPPGAELSGTVKAVRSAAADPQQAPTLDLQFTKLSFGTETLTLASRVASLDNSHETVDDKGVITGTPSAKTYTSELNRGIEKMSGNDRLSGFAGILQAAKSMLVKDTDPDITYDAGVEMTLRTSAPFEVAKPSPGPAAEVQPVSNPDAVAQMVREMPLRAKATDGRPSDLTNILFVGTESQITGAFEAAGWYTAARLSGISKFETARAMIEQRGYKEAPVSVLLVDGRPPDHVYQKQNNTFEARHHLRIWRQPGTFDGRPVWVCAATHDTGISYSESAHTFIHRIDPNIDDERAKVVNDLIFARKVGALALVPREGIPPDAHNATGDPLHTDGEMAVIVLR